MYSNFTKKVSQKLNEIENRNIFSLSDVTVYAIVTRKFDKCFFFILVKTLVL